MFINTAKGIFNTNNSIIGKPRISGSEALASAFQRGADVPKKQNIPADTVAISTVKDKPGKTTYSAGKKDFNIDKGENAGDKPINMFREDWVSDTQLELARIFSSYTGDGGATYRADEMDTSMYDDWFLEFADGDHASRNIFFENQATYTMGILTGTGDYRIHARFHGSSLMVETVEGDERKVFLVDINRVNARDASLVEGFAVLADHFRKNEKNMDSSQLFTATIGFGDTVHPYEYSKTGEWKQCERFDLETRMNFVGMDAAETTVPETDAFEKNPVAEIVSTSMEVKTPDDTLADFRKSPIEDFISKARRDRANVAELFKLYESFEKGRAEADERKDEETASQDSLSVCA